MVFDNEDEVVTRHMVVYDTRGKKVMEKDFDMEYTRIEFFVQQRSVYSQ